MQLVKHPEDAEINRNQQVRLALVIEQNEEHILIGATENIDRALKGEPSASLLCYTKRPVGAFLLSFEGDGKSWTEALDYLRQGYTLLMHSALDKIKDWHQKENVLDYEQRALNILQTKFESDDPVCKYAALRIWYTYWSIRSHPYDVPSSEFDICMRDMENLVRPFHEKMAALASDSAPSLETLLLRWPEPVLPSDTTSTIRIAPNQQATEYILADWSFLPVQKFYVQRIEKDKYQILKCASCGKIFIAKSRKPKYCSDYCRRIVSQAKQAKRLQNKVERLCRWELAYWYDHIKKFRLDPACNAEQCEIINRAYETFRKEKTMNRLRLKHKEMDYDEFKKWIKSQEAVIDELTKRK